MAQPLHARFSFARACLAATTCSCVAVLAASPAPAMHSLDAVGAVHRAPRNTSPPTVEGTPQVGQVLTAAPGTWSGSPVYSDRWERCDSGGGACVDIGGATTTYALTSADVGATIRVAVTATN